MSDRTPTTDEVAEWWAHKGASSSVPYYASKLSGRMGEFDRWLAAERAKAKAEALREAAEVVASEERAFVTSEWGTVVRKLTVMDSLRDRASRIEREAGLSDE